jgi:CP family cyanate transporter-like MFS transporter
VTVLLILAPAHAEAWMLFGGFCNGAMFTLAMSLPLEVADRPLDVGAAAAMMLFFGYLMTALAPSLLGGVRDLTGNFDLVMLCFPIAAVLFLICASLLSPARLHYRSPT